MKRYLMIGLSLSLMLLGGCALGGQTPGSEVSSLPAPDPVISSQPAPEISRPKQTRMIGYEYQCANMQLELPEGWEWSVAEYTPDCFRFGISFWPEGVDSGKVDLFYYPAGFGVCGTGLSQEEILFDSGLRAVQGTYDNAAIWDYISFCDTPGPYVAHTDGVKNWWHDYGEEAMDILGSAVLGQGYITEEEALERARQACGVEYTYEYAEFDFESGHWRIRFRGRDGQNIWETRLDGRGDSDEIELMCGVPLAPKEETA